MIFFAAFVSIMASAADREVINGDIVHVATSSAPDEAAAQFLAQQAAIKSLITECAIPHRDIKIWSTQTEVASSGYQSVAKAVLSYDDCDAAKRSRGQARERLISPEIKKNQDIYDQHLKNQLGISEKRQEPIVQKVVSDEKIDQILSKLTDMDKRLKARPEQPSQVIVVEKTVQIPVDQAAKAACLAQASSIRRQAETAALRNYPPGNMASGVARDLMNQADSMMIGCR